MIKIQAEMPEGIKQVIKNMPHNIVNSLNSLATKGFDVIKTNTPRDTGNLLRSEQLQPAIIGNLCATIKTTLEEGKAYARYVELGTKPHWPPRAPIQGWVERRFHVLGTEAKSLAFLVSRKIARKGTEGRFFFKKGEEYIEKNMPKELEDLGIRVSNDWEAKR